MCAEAPVSVFQLAAAGVESQEERSEADRRAEAQPALTVAALADSGVKAALLDVSEASCLRPERWEWFWDCWAAHFFAFALASRFV